MLSKYPCVPVRGYRGYLNFWVFDLLLSTLVFDLLTCLAGFRLGAASTADIRVGLNLDWISTWFVPVFKKEISPQDKTPCSWQDCWTSIGWCHVYWFALQFWARSLFVSIDNVENCHIAIGKNSVMFIVQVKNKQEKIIYISLFPSNAATPSETQKPFFHIYFISCTSTNDVTTCGCLFICLTDY